MSWDHRSQSQCQPAHTTNHLTNRNNQPTDRPAESLAGEPPLVEQRQLAACSPRDKDCLLPLVRCARRCGFRRRLFTFCDSHHNLTSSPTLAADRSQLTESHQFLTPPPSEVVAEGHSVLIFCGGRRQTQTCAAQVAQLLPALLPPAGAGVAAARRALVMELRDGLMGGGDSQLETLFSELTDWEFLEILETDCP